jgi:hypothetical protein
MQSQRRGTLAGIPTPPNDLKSKPPFQSAVVAHIVKICEMITKNAQTDFGAVSTAPYSARGLAGRPGAAETKTDCT